MDLKSRGKANEGGKALDKKREGNGERQKEEM